MINLTLSLPVLCALEGWGLTCFDSKKTVSELQGSCRYEKRQSRKNKHLVFWNFRGLLQFYEKTKPSEMAKSQSIPPPQLICHWLMTVMVMWMPIWSTPRLNLQMKLWKFSSVKTAGKTRLNNYLILEFLKRTGWWRWNNSSYNVEWSGMLEEGGFPQLP